LILVGAATLLDGDPTNNFVKRALTFNPGGVLNGANNITIAGTYAYITCNCGLVIVNINDPLRPRVVGQIGSPFINGARAVQVQFRYCFVCDSEGVKVIDVTDPEHAAAIPGAAVPMPQANNIYLVRTYAYVAAGRQGLVILDIEHPDKPRIDQVFNCGGQINDARDVKTGMTNASLFAYVADGRNGLRVLQLNSPEDPDNGGFSPRPRPELIATYQTGGPAIAISEGIDRDRAVDESGNQIAVFGRRGSRPLNLVEMMRLYKKDGKVFSVPEINGDRDIVDFYGPPAGGGAGSASRLDLNDPATSVGGIRGAGAAPASSPTSSKDGLSGREGTEKPTRSPGGSGLLFMIVPLAAPWLRRGAARRRTARRRTTGRRG
jgi:hypothetical protein